jgi:hypothetical protein
MIDDGSLQSVGVQAGAGVLVMVKLGRVRHVNTVPSNGARENRK